MNGRKLNYGNINLFCSILPSPNERYMDRLRSGRILFPLFSIPYPPPPYPVSPLPKQS